MHSTRDEQAYAVAMPASALSKPGPGTTMQTPGLPVENVMQQHGTQGAQAGQWTGTRPTSRTLPWISIRSHEPPPLSGGIQSWM